MTVLDRESRQQLIAQLVSTYKISSQAQLVELLAAHDVEVNQATVSRDLEQIGIGKLRGADGLVAYAAPAQTGLAQLLRQFVIDIQSSGNLAVLKTPPGAASAVASAIDTTSVNGVLATLQGDDTVLVVASETSCGRDVAAALSTLKNPPLPNRT